MSGIKRLGNPSKEKPVDKGFGSEKILMELTRFLIFIIIGLSVWRAFEIITEPEIPPSPFEIKLNNVPTEFVEKSRITNKKKQKADALIAEANIRFARGKKEEAARLMELARNTAPGYLKAESGFVEVDRGAAIRESQKKIDDLFQGGYYDLAWKEFEANARRDRGYFSAVGFNYAKNLLDQNYNASAASILMTYTKISPKDKQAQALLKAALEKYSK